MKKMIKELVSLILIAGAIFFSYFLSHKKRVI